MTLEQARQLREAAGQPIHWPEELKPPLSRLVLTRICVTRCEKDELDVSDWSAVLGPGAQEKVEDTCASLGEELDLVIGPSVPPSLRLCDLVAMVEEAFLMRWQALGQLDASEAQLVAMLGRAVGKEITAESKMAEIVPEAKLVGVWERLPEPWSGLWPEVPLKTIWWPLSEKSWGALALWAVVTVVVMRIDNAPLLGRLFLSGLGAWLCKAFLFEQPLKPLWPKNLVTAGDVAKAMRRELQSQLFHWEMLEREWAT